MLTPDNPQNLNTWIAAKNIDPLWHAQYRIVDDILIGQFGPDSHDYQVAKDEMLNMAVSIEDGHSEFEDVLSQVRGYRVPLPSLQHPLSIAARDQLMNTIGQSKDLLDEAGAQVILYGSTTTDLPQEGDIDLLIIHSGEVDDLWTNLAQYAEGKMDDESEFLLERIDFDELVPEAQLNREQLRRYNLKLERILSAVNPVLTGTLVFPSEDSDFLSIQEALLDLIKSNPILEAYCTIGLKDDLARIEERAKLAGRLIE